jgi:hypothetical protein
LCEEYRLLSCSLCHFLHSPVTSSLLSPMTIVYKSYNLTLDNLLIFWCEFFANARILIILINSLCTEGLSRGKSGWGVK